MDATPDPKIDLRNSTEIKLGEEAFKIPNLPLRQSMEIVELAGKLKELGGTPTKEQINTLAMLVHAGLSRAYPTVTLDDLLDSAVSYEELLYATGVVIDRTRFMKRAEPGEASAASL